MLQRHVLAACATVALLLAPIGASAQASSPDSLADALRFRAELGMSTDPSLVAALAADPGAYESDYPILMTADEKLDMDRRVYVASHLDGLKAWGNAHPDEWGGIYIDQAAGGYAVAMLTTDDPTSSASLMALAPAGADLRIRRVSNTLVSLLNAVDTISANLTVWNEDYGVDITDVIVREAENHVEVIVGGSADPVASFIAGQFAPGLVIVVDGLESGSTGCSSRSNCPGPPLRAGIAASTGCSMAFVAKYGSSYYLYSAGHCSNYGSHWYHGSKSLGYITRDVEYNGSTADALLVGPMASADISRWLYYSYNAVVPILHKQDAGDSVIGDLVALSARYRPEGNSAGQVTGYGVHQIEPGIYLYSQRYANYSWAVGDSGGAVYYGSYAKGIQSGYAGTEAVFSMIYWADYLTQATTNTTNCGNYC